MITQNQARILQTAHRQVYNLAAIGDFGRAIEVNQKLRGVLRSWRIQKLGGRFNKGKFNKSK